MASLGLVVLLLVGIIFLVGNSVKIKTKQLEEQQTGITESGEQSNIKVVYKYLPLDIDTFYRVGDMHTPSKLYYSMFSNDESELTQRA